jgi:hypothetical protein
MPKRICVLCLQHIRTSFYFKSQAEKSYNILFRQLNKNKPMSNGSIKVEPIVRNEVVKSTQQPTSQLAFLLQQNNNDDEVGDLSMLVEIEP